MEKINLILIQIFMNFSQEKIIIFYKYFMRNWPCILATLVLFQIDIYLYINGKSWTPLHYESLVPLLAAGSRKKIYQNYASLAGIFLFSGLSIIYFVFGLSAKLSSESFSFLIYLFLFLIIFTILIIKILVNNPRIPYLFFIPVIFIISADKIFMHDMLSSSYLPHFFEIGQKKVKSQSKNTVYSVLKNELSKNRGGVLIVFESLGVPKNNSVIENIARDYKDFDFVVSPHEGGGTISAEIRYLCGYNGQIDDFSECLANKRRALAMHGNTLRYFNRDILYRRIGFQEIFGRHELNNLEDCNYSYHAICDDSLRIKFRKSIKNNNCNELNYLLTIDNHWPFSKYSNHVDDLYLDLRGWLEALRSILKDYPNCKIVIAGDHPPPLSRDFRPNKILTIISRNSKI